MHPPTEQLPIAYRGHRTASGMILEAQTPSGAWRRLDPPLDLRAPSPGDVAHADDGPGLSRLALALATSRLPTDAACAVHQRLRRTLAAFPAIRWHLRGAYLSDLLAELLSPDLAADLAGCPAGETP